jgi:deazaflavin-dependent oxidoreductase (nitroreductase family)
MLGGNKVADRYWRPSWFAARVFNPAMTALGGATLEVAGRRSGEVRRVPLNILDLDGVPYVVALRGNTEWARNLRAAGRCTVRRGRRRTQYRVTELPLAESIPVVDAYRAKWGKQSARFFERMPDHAQHPVFRLEPLN